jgi:hypothetical protein
MLHAVVDVAGYDLCHLKGFRVREGTTHFGGTLLSREHGFQVQET